MKLTSLLQKLLNNVNTDISLSFWLEGDDYIVSLRPTSRADYENQAPNYSVCTQDEYNGARIVELWSPGRFYNVYIDEKKDRWYYVDVSRNGESLRFYGRSRLFFGK